MIEGSSNPFAFEKFPRGRLAFRVTRRRFLPALMNNLHAFSSDVPAHGLDELGTWDNQQLGGVIPKILQGVKIGLKDGYVLGQVKGIDQPLRLFTKDSPALTVFNQMNGSNTLHEITASLMEENGWDRELGFNYVRGLFLWLVLCSVCEPLLPKDEENS